MASLEPNMQKLAHLFFEKHIIWYSGGPTKATCGPDHPKTPGETIEVADRLWLLRRPTQWPEPVWVRAHGHSVYVFGAVECTAFAGYCRPDPLGAVRWIAEPRLSSYLATKVVGDTRHKIRWDMDVAAQEINGELADPDALAVHGAEGIERMRELVRQIEDVGMDEDEFVAVYYGDLEGEDDPWGYVYEPRLYYAQAAVRRVAELVPEIGVRDAREVACG